MENLYKIKQLEAEINALKEKEDKLTWEKLYSSVKSGSQAASKMSFKEYKKSAHPRTFTEMFNENGDRLKENKTYDEIYGKYQLRENRRLASDILDMANAALEHIKDEQFVSETIDDIYSECQDENSVMCQDICYVIDNEYDWDDVYDWGLAEKCLISINKIAGKYYQVKESKLKEMTCRCTRCSTVFDSHDGGVPLKYGELCDECATELIGSDYYDEADNVSKLEYDGLKDTLKESFDPDNTSPENSMGMEGDGSAALMIQQNVLTEEAENNMGEFLQYLSESEELDEGLFSWAKQKYHNWRQRANQKKAEKAGKKGDLNKQQYYQDKVKQHGAAYQGSVNDYMQNANPTGLQSGYNNSGGNIGGPFGGQGGGTVYIDDRKSSNEKDEQIKQLQAELEELKVKEKEAEEEGDIEVAEKAGKKADILQQKIENSETEMRSNKDILTEPGIESSLGEKELEDSKLTTTVPASEVKSAKEEELNPADTGKQLGRQHKPSPFGPATTELSKALGTLLNTPLTESMRLEEKSKYLKNTYPNILKFKQSPSPETLKNMMGELQGLLDKAGPKSQENIKKILKDLIPKAKMELDSAAQFKDFQAQSAVQQKQFADQMAASQAQIASQMQASQAEQAKQFAAMQGQPTMTPGMPNAMAGAQPIKASPPITPAAPIQQAAPIKQAVPQQAQVQTPPAAPAKPQVLTGRKQQPVAQPAATPQQQLQQSKNIKSFDMIYRDALRG